MTRNPLLPLHPALTPPGWRSRAALGLTVAAARGQFRLQVCGACAAVQYPAREACAVCLSHDLPYRDVSEGGELVALSMVRVSGDPFFRRRMPWPVGLVKMDAGPLVVAHLAGELAAGARVRLTLRLDLAGRGVMLAVPVAGDEGEDRVLAALGCDPRGRRVLVTDGRHPVGAAMARAMRDAGAREVFVGLADAWLPGGEVAGFTTVPLDVTDQDSVHQAAGSLGGRVDILVNSALRLRPGGALQPGAITEARIGMELAYFGALRLAQAFGPALQARAEDDGTAWVNIISAGALAARAGFERDGPVQAAALALAASLRGALRPVRALTVLVGPLDDVFHEAVPPPKVAPSAVARAVVRALREGVEEITVGDVAADMLARFEAAPAVLARESE